MDVTETVNMFELSGMLRSQKKIEHVPKGMTGADSRNFS